MANEQLNRGRKPKDPLADGIDAATQADCLKDAPKGPVGGLLAVPIVIDRAVQDRCRR
jgi:hypothetical protein